ncbi:unnamed protein product [Pleuronectes platessa]|uniref:Uncharacterized protein n=1 Tax=Pleuronectes platessa TaxID=8262 RepID=A0A9N7V688_PLEPL|nr:unnamed protein product [Pleuronectes platessa]
MCHIHRVLLRRAPAEGRLENQEGVIQCAADYRANTVTWCSSLLSVDRMYRVQLVRGWGGSSTDTSDFMNLHTPVDRPTGRNPRCSRWPVRPRLSPLLPDGRTVSLHIGDT